MADLGEAFNTLKMNRNVFQHVDYFFTQRTLTEEQDEITKQMNRKINKVRITHNFLALSIPTIITTTTINGTTVEKPSGFEIEIHGDDGYHYKGIITSFQGIIPNLMVPIKGDKKLFVNILYKFVDDNDNAHTKKYVNFIEVPKRFQTIEDSGSVISGKIDNDDNEIDV